MFITKCLAIAIGAHLAAASVLIHGPNGSSTDFVRCDSTDFPDSDLADLIKFGLPNDTKQDHAKLTVTTPIECEKDEAIALETICEGIPGGVSLCEPVKSKKKRSQSKNKRSHAIPRQSQIMAKRGAEYYCVSGEGTCDDTVDANAFAACPSGYTSQEIEVKGHPLGTVCSRPCSAAQRKTCLLHACEYRTAQCNKYPASKGMCGDAVLKCREPVKMKKDICNYFLLPKLDSGSDAHCDGCFSYADGKCTLDGAAYDRYLAADKEQESQRRQAEWAAQDAVNRAAYAHRGG